MPIIYRKTMKKVQRVKMKQKKIKIRLTTIQTLKKLKFKNKLVKIIIIQNKLVLQQKPNQWLQIQKITKKMNKKLIMM